MIIKNQKGGAIVEFAIILPLLVVLSVGICEFGLLVYNKHVITNASREAARAGIVQRIDSDGNPSLSNAEVEAILEGIVINYCSQRLITFGANNLPTVVSTGVNGAFQQDLSVKVTYDYNFLVPSLFGQGVNKTIVSQTLMKMEPVSS